MTVPFATARRKLVWGTEILRTGGGVSLTAGECNAVLDRLADLELAARAVAEFESCPPGRVLARLREVLDA